VAAPGRRVVASATGWGPWLFAGFGVAALVAGAAAGPSDARAAAAQDWPPFALVAGLLLIGVVADGDGVFAAVGRRLAGLARHGYVLFAGATLAVGIVTAVLNLDTSVAFLTPVLVFTARSLGVDESPFLYGVLLLSNAGSLFLPGSNLTNLIVLGHHPSTGGEFLGRMWGPALAALLLTAAVVVAFEHRALRAARRPAPDDPAPPRRHRPWLGLVTIAAAVVVVVVLRSPVLPVLGLGVAAAGCRVVTGRLGPGRVVGALSAPVLVGLFGVAVALGTVGRGWSGPAELSSHLDAWGTAAVGAAASVVVNNLPAASLLAARPPQHPLSLLVGLDVGPNLAVTGSLAWFLWLKVARAAGAAPSVRRASRLGVVAVPIAMVASVGLLVATGHG
jgi:arsenical pump membrane protein